MRAPGGIATRIAVDARVSSGVDPAAIAAGRDKLSAALRIPPATAATTILRGVEHRRPRVLIGLSARLPDLLVRIAPTSYGTLLGALTGHWLPRSRVRP